MASLDESPPRSGPGGRALAIALGLLLTALGAWIVVGSAPEPEPEPDALGAVFSHDVPADLSPAPPRSEPIRRTVEDPLQPVPRGGGSLSVPEPPGADADADELWAYGTTHLDWAPLDTTFEATSELGYTRDELAQWIAEDLELRGLGYPLGYYD